MLTDTAAAANTPVSTDSPEGVAGLIEGNPKQVLIQLYGVVATLIWSGVLTYVLLKVIAFLVPLRVTQQQEIEGLDITQHGEAMQ